MPLDVKKAEAILEKMSSPAKTADQLEQERKAALLSKVQTRLALTTLNRGKVSGGDPGKDHVWINRNDERRVTFEGLGYVVCKDPNVVTQFKKEDGTHVRGDLILYEIPKEEREAMQYLSDIQAVEGLESPKEAFSAFAEQNKVPVLRG